MAKNTAQQRFELTPEGFAPELHHADCLDILPSIPDASVDLILTDPPYGTTGCKWDHPIPFPEMWAQLKRIVKPNRPIVLFAAQPFTAQLILFQPGNV